MSGVPKTLDELRRFYVKHRLQHLPGGGAYMTVIQQDAFIDVHEIPRAEFDQIIAAEVAAAERRGAVRALKEAAEELDESTTADICNTAGVPRPSKTVSDFLTVVYWLKVRAEREESA